MCIEFEKFLGKWELRTGCLVAAFLGIFYSTLLTAYFWFGPYSSYVRPGLVQNTVIGVTVYNCFIALIGLCFAYAVLKEVSWPIDIYKNMWTYLTMTVAAIWIAEFIVIAVVYKMYMTCISLALTVIFLTVTNIYFIMIIRSYQKEMTE